MRANRTTSTENRKNGRPDRLRSSVRCRNGLTVVALLLMIVTTGCSTDWVKLRRRPNTPLANRLSLFSWQGPRPTPRTAQILRRHDLIEAWQERPREVLAELLDLLETKPSPDYALATAELAFIAGNQAEQESHLGDALDAYAVAVANAYNFLLSDRFEAARNPYDPQFREASDIYNGALENAMRIVQRKGQLKPGMSHVLATENHEYEVEIVCRGSLCPEAIEDLKFVSDYRVQGLTNHYRTFGLGVPMIAIHSKQCDHEAAEKYYAPGMTIPVTAFLQVVEPIQPPIAMEHGKVRHRCVLELYDPNQRHNLLVNSQWVPLETDLSTPLAYSLNDESFKQANLATQGLLNPAKSRAVQGLYMLEPYDPDKIPVLMVHGLWSNLVTWMEMFNDLRGTPEIRDQYQFWFYLYPTGQPFWITAAQMRRDLVRARLDLDPRLQSEALDQMVLVGHSMGGLVSRLQTMDSGDDYWNLVTAEPPNELDVEADTAVALRNSLYFSPDPAVKRVVTIASPHRGSNYSNRATRWLGRRFITMPTMFETVTKQLASQDRQVDEASDLLQVKTSIDSLSPDSPILSVMQRSKRADWVQFHNIVGQIAEDGVVSRVAGESDGVVTIESARLPEAVSELVVNADHVNIHRHPRTVLEVQRILLEHLDGVSRQSMQRLPAPGVTQLPLPDDSSTAESTHDLTR